MSATISEMIALRELAPLHYETFTNPERMGNSAAIAYGGCTIAVAIAAAHKEVADTHHLYSIMGSYLGPASIDRPLQCKVESIRKTRTFDTRLVRVSQKQDDGRSRDCMIALADFQTVEKVSMLIYSEPPTQVYKKWQHVPPLSQQRQALVDAGKVDEGLAEIHARSFGLMSKFFDHRPCPEGVATQVLAGLAKTLETTQDDLPLTSKTSADWFRVREMLSGNPQQMAALGFNMDAALSFLPLMHSHMFFDDSGSCSSLDFGLRVFSNNVDFSAWHFKEMKTSVGAEGRTYSEARMWDENGVMVASMTQQSILRPKIEKAEKQAKL